MSSPTNEASPSDQELLDRLYKCIRGGRQTTDALQSAINGNEHILNVKYSKYRDKNILQVACSNLAKCVVENWPENTSSIVELLADPESLAYSTEKENHKEAIHYAALSTQHVLLKCVIAALKNSKAAGDEWKGINSTTSDGDTALNLLIKKKKATDIQSCVELLVENGVDVNISDVNNNTPIVSACTRYLNYLKEQNDEEISSIVNVMDYLVSKGCDVDSYNVGRTETVRTFLKTKVTRIAGARITYIRGLGDEVRNTKTSVSDMNALELHRLAFWYLKVGNENASIKMFRKLSDVDNTDDKQPAKVFRELIVKSDGTFTLMQIACMKKLYEVVKFLLQFKEYNIVDRCTSKNLAPIRIAARKGYVNIFQLLLSHSKGMYEHLFTDICKNFSANATDYEECLNLLLRRRNYQKFLNSADEDGNTALLYLAKFKKFATALTLVQKGALLGVKNREGERPIMYLNCAVLKKHFDSCIDYVEIKYGNNTWRQSYKPRKEHTIRITFSSLLSCSDLPDTPTNDFQHLEVVRMLSNNSTLRNAMGHPLISSFLHLNYGKLFNLYISKVALYALFCALLFVHLLSTETPPNYTIIFISVFQILFFTCSTFRLVVQILCKNVHCVKDIENIIELLLLTALMPIIIPQLDKYRKQASALAIVLSTFMLVLSLGHLPRFATNVKMLKKVTQNFIILCYLVLPLGFACSFFVLFGPEIQTIDGNPFDNIWSSILKTVFMLNGEFNADSDLLSQHPIIGALILFTFTFMMSMVLFNLLNGLAISDISVMMKESQIIANSALVDDLVFLQKLCYRFKNKKLLMWFIMLFKLDTSDICDEVIISMSGKVIKRRRIKQKDQCKTTKSNLHVVAIFEGNVSIQGVTRKKIKVTKAVSKLWYWLKDYFMMNSEYLKSHVLDEIKQQLDELIEFRYRQYQDNVKHKELLEKLKSQSDCINELINKLEIKNI